MALDISLTQGNVIIERNCSKTKVDHGSSQSLIFAGCNFKNFTKLNLHIQRMHSIALATCTAVCRGWRLNAQVPDLIDNCLNINMC